LEANVTFAKGKEKNKTKQQQQQQQQQKQVRQARLPLQQCGYGV